MPTRLKIRRGPTFRAVLVDEDGNLKLCRRCNQPGEFYKNKRAPDGLNWTCKTCDSEASKKWRESNREKSRELSKNWYDRHKEYRAGYMKAYYRRKKEGR